MRYQEGSHEESSYYTMPSDSASVLGVLTTADLSAHRIGNIVEAMHYYSQRDVFPAYYDILLKGRYSLDENTAAIIDMFIPNAMYEFAVQFSENNRPPFYRLSYFMRDMVQKQKSNLTSTYKKVAKQIENGVGTIMEHYK